MYRIFCENYRNFIKSFNEDSIRLEIAKPLELIADINRYEKEKENWNSLYSQFSKYSLNGKE